MSEKNALLLVLQKFNQEKNSITQRLEKAIVFVDQEKSQLIQLQEYEQEYFDKMQSSQQVWSASHITRYRSFCHQLHQAVESQQNKLGLANEMVDRFREQLAVQKHKIQVLQQLIDKKKADKQKEEDKQLQKIMDEFSNRKKSSPFR